MNIAIIGTGNMGSSLARAATRAGLAVALGGRDRAKSDALVAQLSGGAVAGMPQEIAARADIIVLAIPYAEASAALRSLGDVARKVVVDLSNPLTPDFMDLVIGHTTSAAEEIARALPGVRLVKAFNTILAQVMAAGGDFGDRRAPVYIASDDADAKAAVSAFAERIGFEAVDSGPLRNARFLEPMGAQNIQFAYALGWGPALAPAWLRRAQQ